VGLWRFLECACAAQTQYRDIKQICVQRQQQLGKDIIPEGFRSVDLDRLSVGFLRASDSWSFG
jgi:hypothetical protein